MSDPQDLTSRYRLKQLLNWTGSARTFRGSHPDSSEPVAVKLLSISRAPGAFELGRRFENMARVLQALSHPALPRVVEFGLTSTGDGFLVTRWIDGEPLPADRTVAPCELIPLLLQVIEAIETVSLHGVAHLNINPSNLLLQKDGLLRILGWGTSLLTVDWQTSPELQVDAGPANPWAAPELLRQLAPGEALWRADLYSIALIGTTLLGARIEDRGARAPRVRFDKDLSERLKQPEQLRELLELCLRRSPGERPDTYTDLARALQHAMPRGGAPQDTQPIERLERGGSAPRPRPSSPPRFDEPGVTTVLPRPDDTTQTTLAPLVAGGNAPGAELPRRAAGPGGGRDRTVVLQAAATDVLGVRRPVERSPAPPEVASIGLPPGPPGGPPEAGRPKPGSPTAPPAHDASSVAVAAASAVGAAPAPGPPPVAPPAPSPPGGRASSPAAAPTITLPTRFSSPSRAAAPSRPVPPPSRSVAPPAPTIGSVERSSPRAGTVATGSMAPLRPAAGSPPESATTAGGGNRAPLILGLAAAALLFLLVVAGGVAAIWWVRGRDAPTRTVTVEQNLPEGSSLADQLPDDAPPVPLPPELEQALLQIADGELLEARATLEELGDLEEEGGLPSEISLAYYSVLETLQRARAEEVTGQLTEGLGRYDLASLDATLRAMNGDEERLVAADPDGLGLLNRARAVLSTASSLEQAIREGRLVDALEGANRLQQDDAELAAALGLRERAASAIERSIDTLVEEARLDEADQRLRELERLWPGRDGTAERRRTIQARIQSKERWESLIQSAVATGRQGRPHEGLEMIAGAEIPADYRERIGQVEESLRQQLRQADRQAPLLQLVEQDPEYRRNQPVVLEFEVTDDYEVLELSVRARRANADDYDQMTVERIGDDRYRVELSPSFHDNKPILFWAEARDRLGNVTRLAGPDSPVELRRGRRRRGP